MDGYSVQVLLDRPAGSAVTAPVPEELTNRLLRAAGVTVTAVSFDELGPEVTVARIELNTPIGPRHVIGRLADGLALAAAAGAPVQVADPVMDRLAVPEQGDDLLGRFIQRELAADPSMPRRQARNLAFVDGLDGWQLHGSFLRDASGSHWHDYSCTAEGQSAILSSAVPQPHGSAYLSQEVLTDHYRRRTVTFRGELRTERVTGRARLYVRVRTEERARAVHDHQSTTVSGR